VVVGNLPVYARVAEEPAATGFPPVVLVHGLVVSSRYMVPTAELLAPYYHVYAPDLPGFGRSGKPAHVLTLSELADALLAWMDATGWHRAVLLGNSFGCQVIADFALRYPEHIERAVLVGPTVDPKARSVLRQVMRWLRNSTREPLSLGPILIRDYIEAGAKRALSTFKYALEDRIEDKLPHLQVPTLVVRGARDPIVPQRWAEKATGLLPHGRLVVIPGAAHTVNYDAPLELVRVVQPFLQEDRQDRARRDVA
jgi:pimeloyl-ACP methyl ester carboxylesterase